MGGRIFAYWPKLRTHPVGIFDFYSVLDDLFDYLFGLCMMTVSQSLVSI